MRPLVEVRSLSKHYGSRVAVDRVSFEVEPGEVLGLLGPNGSGKSTILRMLTGYLAPASGTALINGFDIVSDPRSARGCVGYVPEDVPLYQHMRVDELLRFMGRMRGLEGKALALALDAARERLALDEVRRMPVGKLSRGYRQRVAIALALLHGPRLVVLDEPTNGLDPRQIIELRHLVQCLATQCSVLVTSHVLGEIERMAHRVAILMDGRLLKIHSLRPGAADRQRWLRLQIHAPASTGLSSLLTGVPGVVAVEPDGSSATLSRWRVQVTDIQAGQYIVAALSGAGLGVGEMTEAAADLEHLFLRLTSASNASPMALHS